MKYILAIGLMGFFVVSGVFYHPQSANALSGSDFNAGEIIDDPIFTNDTALSVQDIQNFLEDQVPTCDTNGTEASTHPNGSGGYYTHAQWGAINGNSAPFTCLKDYVENTSTLQNNFHSPGSAVPGGISAAQIIWNASQEYQINPEVLLVTMQKEQGLVTDNWPWYDEFQYAMGYSCPDSSGCSSTYADFYKQVDGAAYQFRYYLNHPGAYNYWIGNNYIQYSPNTACGGSVVNIQNAATAALYIYTPYQPDNAALANVSNSSAGGTGDGCSAYGNRNFWWYFNTWFGPSVDSRLYYAVIQGPDSPAIYLQTPAGKYYIPSGTVETNWGLDSLPIRQVTESYLDSLPTHDWLNDLLVDDYGNYFVVDDGNLHYVRSPGYLQLWGLDPSVAAQSLGLAYTLHDSTWLGRFVQDSSQPSGTTYLVDGGQKRPVPDTNTLYEWGYTPDQLTTMSTAFLGAMTTGNTVTQYATDGSTNYLVDMDRKLSFPNADLQNAYYGSATASSYSAITLSFLPTAAATQFALDSQTGQWFMFEAGRRHYITSAAIAQLWGESSGKPLTGVSDSFIQTMSDGGNLSYVVQTASPSQYWLIDGTKHYMPTSDVAQAWLASGASPPTYSSQSLDLLTNGANATTTINAVGSPYTYTMDNGIKHYLMNPGAVSGWGGTVLSASPQLVNSIPEGAFVNYLVKDTSGQGYLLLNGSAYTIDPDYYDVWGINSSTTVVDDQTFGRYPVVSGTTLQAFIRVGSTSYVMTGGSAAPIRTYADAYDPSSLGEVTLPNYYLNTTAEASYLVKSTDSSDSSVWLINQGQKTLLNFEQEVSYGYLSRGVQPTQLSPATLATIPDDTRQASLLIQDSGSGVKLISFGYALSFPNGDALTSYIGSSNPVLQVSPSIFNTFALRRPATQLLEDDAGNYYWMENGAKSYIYNWSILTRYLGTPVTYLEGTTMYLIPNGPEISH